MITNNNIKAIIILETTPEACIINIMCCIMTLSVSLSRFKTVQPRTEIFSLIYDVYPDAGLTVTARDSPQHFVDVSFPRFQKHEDVKVRTLRQA